MTWIENLGALADLADALAWPAVAVGGVLLFRDQIRALIGRIRKGGGLEFDAASQSDLAPQRPLEQAIGTAGAALRAGEGAGFPPMIEAARTPTTRRIEELVRDLPVLTSLADQKTREDVLVSMTARAILVAQFERIEALIWRSQLSLLEDLNSKTTESAQALRKAYYDPLVAEYPDVAARQPFDDYLGFLRNNELIEREADAVKLTPRGHEYLNWRISQRKPPKYNL